MANIAISSIPKIPFTDDRLKKITKSTVANITIHYTKRPKKQSKKR